MAQDSYFDQFPAVGTVPAAPRPAPRQAAQPAPQRPTAGPMTRTIVAVPDPKGDRAEQRDETRLDSTLQGDQRAASKDQFDRVTTYRKEFLTEPLVREFRGVQNATNQIVELAKRENDQPGPGDIALIISFMKALDPGSVVRETEFATAENAGGVPETVRNAYNKLLNGGRLTPEIKREFASTATAFYNSRLSGYNAFAEDYRGLVSAEGADPDAQGIRLAEPLAFGDGQGGAQQGGAETEFQSRLNEANQRGATFDELLAIAKEYGRPGFQKLKSQEDLDAFRAKGGSFVVPPSATPPPPEDPRVSQLADEIEASQGQSGLGTLANAGGTLGLVDEVAGVGGAIGRAITGDFSVAENYTLFRDVERELQRRARERTGGVGVAAELLGGGGAVRTVGNAAMNAGRMLAGSGAPVTRGAIQGQMARQAGVEGAAVGGIAGFGYGEGTQESLTGAGVGAAGGYLLGRGGQALANRGTNRGGGSGGAGGPAAPTTPGGEVIQAADNFNAATGANVQPIPADVGGSVTRRASGATVQSVLGGKPIIEAAQRANTEAQAGVRTLASRQGAVPQSKQAGGEVAIKGAEKTIQRTKLKVDALYAKARKESADARVPLPFAKTVAQQEIANLADTPGGVDPSAKLREVVGDLDGEYTVEGIRRFRKTIRDKLISDNLRGSEIETAAMRIVDAAENDIEDGLVALGKPAAAKAYAEAAKTASERFTLIDDVLTPILGRKGEKSGEQAFAAIDQLSRGDAVTLGKFMRALPEDEAGSVRGILIDRLGRASKGRQDADGQAFSMNDFLTRWNDEGISREAKSVLFDGETIAALDDLARVAQGTKEAQRFANFSNSAGSIMFNTLLNGSPLSLAPINPVAAGGIVAASTATQLGFGRLLASPRFARWLAKMPKQPNQAAVRKHVDGLSRIAAADATIASDALGLQQQLLARFQPGQVPLAAEAQGENTGRQTPTDRRPE